MKVQLDDGAYMPEYAHEDDAGMDLRSPDQFIIPSNGSCVIDTGVHVEIPKGYAGFLKSKSGLNVKSSITSEGVIDTGYTGPIVVKLYNHGNEPKTINRGDKITQLVLVKLGHGAPFELVDKLTDTERGTGGFGSTGV